MQIVGAKESELQAYRVLARRDNPQSPARSLTMLQNILKFDFAVGREQNVAVLDSMVLFGRLVIDDAMAGERCGSCV